MRQKTSLLLCALLFWGFQVGAIELKLDQEEWVETQHYNEDYLFLGEQLTFEGEAKDLYFLAEQAHFQGKSTLAIHAAADEVTVAGTVGNGVKAAARRINLTGTVTGTNFMAAEKVTFAPESEITGDSFMAARKITISGKMTGDLYVAAGELSIQNEVHGNVKVFAGQLKIGEQGKIIGNLTYQSDHELSAEEVAQVTGEISFEKNEGGPFNDHFNDSDFGESVWFSILFKLAFIVFGLLVLLFPVNKHLEKRYTGREIRAHSLWGLIPIFVYPSALVISIILLITLPLALSMLLAFVPLVFVTKTLGLTMIGSLIATGLNLKSTSRYIHFLSGAIFYSILSFIPFFGALLLVFVTSLGCGLILSKLFDKKFV